MEDESIQLLRNNCQTEQQQRYMATMNSQSAAEADIERGSKEEMRATGLRRWPILVSLAALGVMAVAASVGNTARRSSVKKPETSISAFISTPKMNLNNEDILATLAPVKVTTVECAGDRTLPVVRGVDVVSYFSLDIGSNPLDGSPEHTAVLDGYMFYFSSEENKLTFESDPYRYVPSFGGFCSYGIAHEEIWNPEQLGPPSNPNYWIISPQGKLYLFRSSIPRGKFMQEMDSIVAHGNAVWYSWFTEHGDGSGKGPFDTACFCTDEECTDA